MSDKPIQVGDFVMVVRPSFCIGGDDGIGFMFVVRGIFRDCEISGECMYCGKDHHDNELMADDGDISAWSLSRLKRIDPDILKDGIPNREELTA